MKSVSAGIVSVLPGHDDVGHDVVNCLALPCLLIMMDRDLWTCEPNKSPFQLMVFVTAMKVLLTHCQMWHIGNVYRSSVLGGGAAWHLIGCFAIFLISTH